MDPTNTPTPAQTPQQGPFVAPPMPAQPNPAYPGAYPPASPSNGKGIVGLILGILAFLSSWIALFGIVGILIYLPLPIAAIIVSVFGLKHIKKGLAITGLILGSLGLVGGISFALLGGLIGVSQQAIVKKAQEQAIANQTTVDTNTSTAAVHKIGEAVQADGFSFTVNSAARHWSGKTVDLYPGTAEEYIHVLVTLKNTSSSAVSINPMVFNASLDGQAGMFGYNPESDDLGDSDITLKAGESVTRSVNLYYNGAESPVPTSAEFVYYPQGGKNVQRVTIF